MLASVYALGPNFRPSDSPFCGIRSSNLHSVPGCGSGTESFKVLLLLPCKFDMISKQFAVGHREGEWREIPVLKVASPILVSLIPFCVPHEM